MPDEKKEKNPPVTPSASSPESNKYKLEIALQGGDGTEGPVPMPEEHQEDDSRTRSSIDLEKSYAKQDNLEKQAEENRKRDAAAKAVIAEEAAAKAKKEAEEAGRDERAEKLQVAKEKQQTADDRNNDLKLHTGDDKETAEERAKREGKDKPSESDKYKEQFKKERAAAEEKAKKDAAFREKHPNAAGVSDAAKKAAGAVGAASAKVQKVTGAVGKAANIAKDINEQGVGETAKQLVATKAKRELRKKALAALKKKAKVVQAAAKRAGSAILRWGAANPAVWWALGVVLLGLLIFAIVGGLAAGLTATGGAGSTSINGATNPNASSSTEWNNSGFMNSIKQGKTTIPPGYQNYPDIFDLSGGFTGGVNYVAGVPATVSDMRNVGGKHIANAAMPGPGDIQITAQWVSGNASVELHLPTSQKAPFDAGSYQQIAGLELTNRDTKKYMTGPKAQLYTEAKWLAAGKPHLAQGAFGLLPAKTEEWYMNMRWPYTTAFGTSAVNGGGVVGHSTDYDGKKVLITDKTTGKMVVAIIGEFGPGARGKTGNRIAGMSPDVMYYLGGGKVTGADAHVYTFGFLEDQSIAAGPLAIGSAAGGNPPTSSKGLAAVWWAETKLGAPYIWAAAGPNTFDCSGLTMWAYKHVGINLSHYSRAQINEGAPVAKANLQPGDLVFFGSPIHHVGMYIGNGKFIEAPHTGAFVRITTLAGYPGYAGACRPS